MSEDVFKYKREDFEKAVIFGCDSAEWCAEAANARLPELLVATEEGNEFEYVRILKEHCRNAAQEAAIYRRERDKAESELKDLESHVEVVRCDSEKLQISNAKLRVTIEFVLNRNRSRGYPTGREWEEMIERLRDALEGK